MNSIVARERRRRARPAALQSTPDGGSPDVAPAPPDGKVIGFVDGLIGSYVNGWAAAMPGGGHCRITIRTAAGHVLASALGTRERPDLEDLGLGSTAFGFRVSCGGFEDVLPDGRLHVFADDVELPGSPMQIGRDLFDGFFAMRGDVASGWVTRRSAERVAPRIELKLPSGRIVGRAIAAFDELEDAAFAPARFDIPLDMACFGRGEILVGLYADGIKVQEISARLVLDGYIDMTSAGHCAGWLVAPDAPGRTLTVEAWRDGRRIGSGRCTIPRSDLQEKFPNAWHCGFSFPLKTDADADKLGELSLRLCEDGPDILGGPFLVGPRTAFVGAAKHVAALVHQTRSDLNPLDRAVFQEMVRSYLGTRRHGDDYLRVPSLTAAREEPQRPVSILIPIYKGIDVTEACIRSVLANCGPQDTVVLVSDCPPEAGMRSMLGRFRSTDRIVLLSNETNLGFVGAVNRGLDFCRSDDVLLLNSDTRLFPGALDELRRIMHGAADIATVTAMSNNATIFSYPHPALAAATLDDIAWSEVAEVVRAASAGRSVDVPTGHGFCMLVRREVLDRLGSLNDTFGRGYGEENELCLRATDLGFRHVAALGAFVEHRESVSFGDEKEALISVNLPQLEAMYPEYTPTIMAFERIDPLRGARWPVDIHRLRKARLAGTRFMLSIENWFGGGTVKAIEDAATLIGFDGRTMLRLKSLENGMLQFDCPSLSLRALFAPGDETEMLAVLEAADPDLVVAHQLLGMTAPAIETLGGWAERRAALGRKTYAYAHDFYSLCPRVTLIDAIGEYCGVAPSEICTRCIAMGGTHEGSKVVLDDVAAHRALFAGFFGRITGVIAPSGDTVRHLRKVFPDAPLQAVPHPTIPGAFTGLRTRAAGGDDIVLLGGIGPHKGSATLRDVAAHAALTHPHLTFHVVGHTDIDAQFETMPNVVVHGRYEAADLPAILGRISARIALFLHGWPETYSYTLSEAVLHGLVPVVPDLGAPAERVRATGYGLVFPYPIVASQVLSRLDMLRDGTLRFEGDPTRYAEDASVPVLQRLFNQA